MILQGLFNIFSLYLDNIDVFFNSIDKYYRDKIETSKKLDSITTESVEIQYNKLKDYIISDLIEIGLNQEDIENKFLDPFTLLEPDNNIKSIYGLYEQKLAPIIYEFFLEKVVDYLVDLDVIPIILNLKSKGFLGLEVIIDLKNLKSLMDKYPEKKENLKKYLHIPENFTKKLSESKTKIESLEDLKEPKDKLQLVYLIYRIISFFFLGKKFDLSHIRDYIENNIDEWLVTIPLVTLKNPDLYYCGLFLAKVLNIPLDENKVKKFLLELYEEGIDEFEAPLVEATDGIYYFLKSTQFKNLWLTDEQIIRLVEADPKFFESAYLKNLETSQLVVILKIYNLLKLSQNEKNIEAIIQELDTRISPEGIKQYREGLISSEATYYVLFSNYMRNSLINIKDLDLLSSIVSRIYRNLEILEFSADMNYDLISELFYSFESLKLFNCIETKQMIVQLAKYLFPQEVVDKIAGSGEEIKTKVRFRHLKVDRITGETLYS